VLLKIGSRYSFDVYPSSVIGNNFKNVQVLALMDAPTAAQYADIMALHEAVKPSLPVGTVADPLKFTYARLRTSVGSYVVVAYEWINVATIAEVFSSRISIVVNNTSPSDPAKLRNLLINANYPDIEISVL
jgi:hypothetical protein